MVDEIAPLLVSDGGRANPSVEVDVLEHAFERWVVSLEGGERLVESVTDLVMKVVANVTPTALRRHEERFAVVIRVIGPTIGVLLAAALGELICDDLLAFNLEYVARPLQEQRSEDVLLELGGIHLPAQYVCGSEQMPLKLRKGEHPCESTRSGSHRATS